jgi:two-component system, NtrC family, response regulator PilR
MSKILILVVDDEQSMREFLSILLEKDGYAVVTAASGAEALGILKTEPVELVITDIQMDGMSGLELIARIKASSPDIAVLAITAYGSSEIAIDAMKNGAYDYITKPFQVDEIRIIVTKALENIRLREENLQLRKELHSRSHLKDIVGTSEAMQKVYQVITRVADLDSTVLLTGESGTGKELVARAIHFWGRRRRAPFISVNCGALPETLLESELFGHQKGSFTGAITEKRGLLEAADGGTFFLDEIGDTPPVIQVKLLQAIQTKRFKHVGGNSEISVDVRFIAATNRDLHRLVHEKQFREDLFYRLNVIPVHLPPLRERREDIPLLVGHFLKRFSEKCGTPAKALTTAAQEKLISYSWPGNARELENVIERTVALAPGELIDEGDMSLGQTLSVSPSSDAPELAAGGMDLEAHLESIERSLISQALDRCGGNKTEAARLLGLTFRSLRYRAEKLGLG